MKKTVSLFSWYEFKSMRYSHFVVFQNTAYGFIGVYSTNGFFSVIWPPIKKIRTLYILQLLKLMKIKCLIFLIGGQMRYSHFVDLTPINPQAVASKTSKWLYLSHLTSYQNNKTTSFSSTLKVEENKVSLFFGSDVI